MRLAVFCWPTILCEGFPAMVGAAGLEPALCPIWSRGSLPLEHAPAGGGEGDGKYTGQDLNLHASPCNGDSNTELGHRCMDGQLAREGGFEPPRAFLPSRSQGERLSTRTRFRGERRSLALRSRRVPLPGWTIPAWLLRGEEDLNPRRPLARRIRTSKPAS